MVWRTTCLPWFISIYNSSIEWGRLDVGEIKQELDAFYTTAFWRALRITFCTQVKSCVWCLILVLTWLCKGMSIELSLFLVYQKSGKPHRVCLGGCLRTWLAFDSVDRIQKICPYQCRGPEGTKRQRKAEISFPSWTGGSIFSYLRTSNFWFSGLWTLGLTLAAPWISGLHTWTEFTTGFPGSPASRWPIIGLPVLHHPMSQTL